MVWDKAWSWRAKGVPSPFAFAAGWKKAGNELGEVVG
jgi:hypothetical protein